MPTITFPDVPGVKVTVDEGFTEQDIEEIYDEVRPSTGAFRKAIGDTAVALAKGVVAFPQGLAGLVDIGAGLAGTGSFSEAIKPLVDFETTQSELGKLYSPDAKRAQRRVDQAKGVWDTLTTVLKNPSIIQQQMGESLPSMLGGAAAAKKLIGAGVGRAAAAGIGEGTITAGQQASDIREATPGGDLSPGQAGAALVSGVFTAAIGKYGNKLAERLGVGEIDTLFSPKASETVKRSIIARALGGMVIEGGFEELPQGLQEQITKNLATGKPWNEGLEKAGVLGTIVGGLMGAGAGVIGGGKPPPAAGEDQTTPTTPATPVTETDQLESGVANALEAANSLIPDKPMFNEGRPIDQSGTLPPEVPVPAPQPTVSSPEQPVAPPQVPNLLPRTAKVMQDMAYQMPEPLEGQPYDTTPQEPLQSDLEAAVKGASDIELEGTAPTALTPEEEAFVTETLKSIPESVELNELRIVKEQRGLGRLNSERLAELEAKEKAEKEKSSSQKPVSIGQNVSTQVDIESPQNSATPTGKVDDRYPGSPVGSVKSGYRIMGGDKFTPDERLAHATKQRDQLIAEGKELRSKASVAPMTGSQFELRNSRANKNRRLAEIKSQVEAWDAEIATAKKLQPTTPAQATAKIEQEVKADFNEVAAALKKAYPFQGVKTGSEARAFVFKAKRLLKPLGVPSDVVDRAVESERRPGLIVMWPSDSSILRGLLKQKWIEEPSTKSSIDQSIAALEAKIKSLSDTSQAVLIPGLDPSTARAVYNSALRIAIGVLKATKNIQQAIQAAINYIKTKATLNTAQEDDLRQELEGSLAYRKGVLTRAALQIARGTALPKSMVEARRRQLDHQKFIEESIKLKAEDVRAAINTEFKTKTDQEAANTRLADFLNGAIPVSAVGGPEVQLRAAAVRSAIDNLSMLAINKSMVTGDMATTWLGNMGAWLKRTYLAFDTTADWNYDTLNRRKGKGDVEINRIWKNTHDFLAAQNPTWNEARIEAEMRSLIDRITVEDVLGIETKTPAGTGPRLSTEISSLLRRKNIPDEIREWMGEIKDPYAKVLQSGKWLAQFITRNIAQREIASIGLETGVLSKEKSGRYTEELFPGEDRLHTRHEPLAGYWTTPEFRDALEEFDARLNNTIATLSFGSMVGKAILTGTAYQKGALVGWNPASYGVNIIGGAVIRLATGAVNPVHLKRALNAVAFGGNPISTTSTKRALEARADYLMASKAGAVGKGILLGDIDANLSREREPGAGRRAVAAIKGILSDPKAKGQYVKLKRSLDDLWRIPGDYGIRFMDDVLRTSAFFDELSLATKAFPTMAKDQQVRWAADRALNIYQNYDRLPKGLRDASRVGALNTFVSFKAEMFRNAYWIARYAKEGMASKDPALRRDGVQKMVGLLAMSALPFIVSALSKSKNDIDDEEDKAMKRWIVPPWDRSEELVYVKGENGKYTYIPMGYLLPTFEYARPFTTIWNAANDPNPDEATLKAMSGWASDYLGPGAFIGPLMESGFNFRLGSDRKVTLKHGLAGAKERVEYAAESFVPRGIRMLEEAYKAYNQIPGDFGREYSGAELGARLAGLRERTVDVHKAAPFVLRSLGNRWREASSDENLQSRKYPVGSPKALEAIQYEIEVKSKLKALYNQAITDLQRLGVSEVELNAIAKDIKLPLDLRK